MSDVLLDPFRQVFLFTAEPAGNERGSSGQSQRNWIHRCFDVAEGHAIRFHADAAGGRGPARSTFRRMAGA